MKNTLEYKILRYLKENDNGDFIDMRGFINDRKLLESKLRSLMEPKRYISARFPLIFFGIGLPDYKSDTLEAKIEFYGIKYLNEIESQSLTKQKPWYIKFLVIFWKLISENQLISSIIGALIIAFLMKLFF